MKQTKLIMGMPITVEIVDTVSATTMSAVFAYFRAIDKRFSTYKSGSEISLINKGLPRSQWSSDMKTIMKLCEQTRAETNGYFDIAHDGKLDPSGLVKGWAIQNAAEQLREKGAKNFYVDGGGDIQVSGKNSGGEPWLIGIRNPFNREEVIKTIAVSNEGVATSGTYIRGEHIYNPLESGKATEGVKSLTVIGPNIYEADRFATAAFAMGTAGIKFIESKAGFEGYMVDNTSMATYTSGFNRYVSANA